jgi:hypothetical protein
MTDDEVSALVEYLAANPTAGDVIPGTGGCRKLRWAGRGKGKSGGYRTITFYTGALSPVYLLTVFGKGAKANLSKVECNELKAIADTLATESAERIAKARSKGKTNG